MKKLLGRVKIILLKLFLYVPVINHFSMLWYRLLGVIGNGYRISPMITVIGSYANLELGKNSEINTGCFLLLKDKINIGENSTLAYQTTVLTSSNPNGPYNKLIKLYPRIVKPVLIGKNTWIGARTTILPGVTIGNYCVVAAGAVVHKDIPDYTVVAGVPAKVIKHLNPDDLE